MNIAYLSTFYPFRGGIAQFNAALYKAFQQQGDTVNAFNFSRQYPDILFPGSSQYVTAEDNAEKIDTKAVLDTINPYTYFTTANKIKKTHPDLMVMKFWMPFFAPSLGTASYFIKKKTKIITVLDNVIPHERRPGDIALTKFFLNQNHGFVAMSEAVKNDLLTLKPDAKYIFHPHPLYDHFGEKLEKQIARKKLDISIEKKVILFFGFIRDYKGLDLLIEAMKNTPDDYLLLIAGEVYGDFTKYNEQIDAARLGSKIKLFVQYISDNEVPLFFSAADVSVLPYKSATQSGITSIAFHFDLPVIATDVGGLKESVHHEKTGLIIDHPESKQINSALLRYFTENHSEAFAANIRLEKKMLSWDHLATEIKQFYSEL